MSNNEPSHAKHPVGADKPDFMIAPDGKPLPPLDTPHAGLPLANVSTCPSVPFASRVGAPLVPPTIISPAVVMGLVRPPPTSTTPDSLPKNSFPSTVFAASSPAARLAGTALAVLLLFSRIVDIRMNLHQRCQLPALQRRCLHLWSYSCCCSCAECRPFRWCRTDNRMYRQK